MNEQQSKRRDVLKAAATALTTSIFPRSVKGANDRISVAFIGTGAMGRGNIRTAMKQNNVAVAAVCDVYQPHLEEAVAVTKSQAKPVRDFREILADKSVDVVCIATPDHWHAYMMVEACKAGKDVYVEKPVCTVVEEGKKMVEAARKHNRVVQVGLQQRSGLHFQKAVDMVRGGRLGKVTFCRAWNYGLMGPEGFGNFPDSDPPPGLDWDMWLGPAPRRPFNQARFGVIPKWWSTFRYFWDYAGGMMTDWGVHLLDIVQWAFDDVMPAAVTALGGKYWLKDSRDSPDTLQVTYEYPGFLAVYENRSANGNSMFGRGYGILFHGAKGTLFVDRNLYRVIPEGGSDLEPVEVQRSNDSHSDHWANFLECVRTRRQPVCDIEAGFRSTATCLLGNVALRSGLRVDWDSRKQTALQPETRRYLSRPYRKPWKLVV